MVSNSKIKNIVWNWHKNIDEFEVANEIGFDLLPGCKINNSPRKKTKTRDDEFNVVIVDHFFYKGNINKKNIKQDYSWADLVIHYTREIIIGPWEHYQKTIIENFNNTNFITVCNGVVGMPDYPRERVYMDAQTFFTRIARYGSVMKLEQANNTKPMMFDALLGKKNTGRDKLFNLFKENNLLDNNLVNYYDEIDKDATTLYRSPELDRIDTNPITGFSARAVKPGGVPRSHIIDQGIYDNTWFSVVAETRSGTTFITEKTTKCLLSGRMFVLFGEKGHLAKLRSYGYKTFASHIDESYDDIEDENERIKAAFTQVNLLTQRKDLAVIMQDLHSTFVHNQNLCLENIDRLEKLKSFLLPHVTG